MKGPVLLACGSNASGQLSLGHLEDAHNFQPVHFHPSTEHLLPEATIINLVSSSTHSLLLLQSPALQSPQTVGGPSRQGNILLGCGKNTVGQLGPKCALWEDVTAETRFKPIDLLTGSGFDHEDWEPVNIACTWTSSFVVYRRIQPSTDDLGGSKGSVVQLENGWDGDEIILSCGSNDFGELGIESDQDFEGVVPVTSASKHASLVDVGLKKGEKVEMIKGGQKHVLVIISSEDGQRVVGWGANRRGELSPSSPTSTNTVNPKGKGKGRAARPKYILPTALAISIPPGSRIMEISLGVSHSVILFSDGTVFAWGDDGKGQIRGLEARSGVKQIACTWGGTYMFEGQGRLYSQGANGYNQLLHDEGEEAGKISSPPGSIKGVVAGSEHIMVIIQHEGNELWVGGWNEHGNLGLGDTSDRGRLVQVDLIMHGDGRKISRIWGGCAAGWVLLE